MPDDADAPLGYTHEGSTITEEDIERTIKALNTTRESAIDCLKIGPIADVFMVDEHGVNHLAFTLGRLRRRDASTLPPDDGTIPLADADGEPWEDAV